MIEFKRAGDVMVFECQAFKIEVLADSERITISEEASNDHRATEVVIGAFEILDMMIEHKNKRDGNNPPGHRFREYMKRRGL